MEPAKIANRRYDNDVGGGWNGEPFISTSQVAPGTCPDPATADHLSMAIDNCMPNGSGAYISPASVPGTETLEVFEAYVDALCALEP